MQWDWLFKINIFNNWQVKELLLFEGSCQINKYNLKIKTILSRKLIIFIIQFIIILNKKSQNKRMKVKYSYLPKITGPLVSVLQMSTLGLIPASLYSCIIIVSPLLDYTLKKKLTKNNFSTKSLKSQVTVHSL